MTDTATNTIERDVALEECLWLVRYGVPYNLAFHADDACRALMLNTIREVIELDKPKPVSISLNIDGRRLADEINKNMAALAPPPAPEPSVPFGGRILDWGIAAPWLFAAMMVIALAILVSGWPR